MSERLLDLIDINLNYGKTAALKHINFRLSASESHAIVGERGSGKSSLAKIICGQEQPDSGVIHFHQQRYRALTIKKAHSLGIEMVYQQVDLNEVSFNPHFTVADSLFFRSGKTFFWENKRRRYALVAALLKQYGVSIDPGTFIHDLSVSQQLLLDILKRINRRPRILILDEVLNKLSPGILKTVSAILKPLKTDGMAILYLSSRIDDIYEFADTVSVMRNGEILLTDYIKNIGKFNLIRMTYTQISREENIEKFNQEFYQFLRYNEAILRNLPVNLIVTDTQQRVKMVNESCKNYFRLHKPSYFNRSLQDVFGPENQDVQQLISQSMASEQERTFYQIPMTIATSRTVNNIKSFPIFEGKNPIGHFIIIEDISEYDRLQEQVMLSEKLASVGLLAAGVAHEINNPLEIIYNYLSYIKYNFKGKELHSVIDNVHEEISDIATIVSNLHSFSDKQPQMSGELLINDVIHKILKLIKHHANRKAIGINFTPCEEELMIQANKNEIKQVLLNLFKNSFEAMPSGGEITITTEGLHENGRNVARISFQDSGLGIDDDNPNNIFLPFYSTKQGSKQNFGLGLSVSYGIITKYHGTIVVSNLEGSGCRFQIDLPQYEANGEKEP
ncbi:histidine kinase [candidate division KSB3 bacterium]|uniref:histidine kinase n=1 Tax=candidate division KSB3 bacterium TaxID=2044937 RepID=A0A2G6E5C8_9BACT|nr:MAG: histidine kinase [candidate division KSB3 bacterium]PIE29621.1 MAG: histidine kinase [candidate division KSB3 bacterium]